MPVSFRGVYQRGSVTQRPKSEIGRPSSSPPSLLQAAGVLPWSSLLLLLRTQDGAQSHYYKAALEAVQVRDKQRQERSLNYRTSHHKYQLKRGKLILTGLQLIIILIIDLLNISLINQ